MAHRSNLFVYFEISLSDGSDGISNLTSSLHCCKQRKNRELVNTDRDRSASSSTYHNTSLQSPLIVSHFFLYILLGPIHRSWAPFNARLDWVDAAGFVIAALCCTHVHITLQHSNGNDVTFKVTREMIVRSYMSYHTHSDWHTHETFLPISTTFCSLACIFRNTDRSKSSMILVISVSTRCRCCSIVTLIVQFY